MKNICGGLTVALGVVSVFWDGMELIEAYEKRKRQAKSKMGEELRRIADELEEALNRQDGG